MKVGRATTLFLIVNLLTNSAFAQSPQRSTNEILSFEIQGINALMVPERAREVLLDAGFTEKRSDDWGKVPTADFSKDNITVAISHFEGTIYGLTEFHTFTGELFDYSGILARIKSHFDIGDEDPACVERDYGTRCAFGDGEPKGARFIASLTTQQISIQFGKRR